MYGCYSRFSVHTDSVYRGSRSHYKTCISFQWGTDSSGELIRQRILQKPLVHSYPNSDSPSLQGFPMVYKRIREALSFQSFIPRWNHDVFLSFSEDTGNTIIIDGLYDALIQVGVRIFREDVEHKREEKQIEESRIAIVLFSRKYVSSMWCLDELVKILECRSRTDLTVLPVFCDVDPSEVRRQTGSLAEAFARYGERLKDEKEKVDRWRAALTKAANLSGFDLQNLANGQEAKFIQRVVDDVLTKLNRTALKITSYPVGIEFRAAKMKAFIDLSPFDVCIIGICGTGGLGKTTIAKAVYNEIYHEFDGSSFLENVREVSKQPNGLIHLQEQLLSDILMKKNLKISNVARGINVIKQRLQGRRVLIIIDDVDQSEQLNALAIKRDSFGEGSRIIVISRDEHLLNEAEVCQGEIYRPEELDFDESLQLFSWHAFKNDYPPDDYMELSKEVVGNVKGLPLALEVMGSLMFGKRCISEWESVLAKLNSIPDYQIQKKLRLSFYALDDTEKDIFLDIACFFVGIDQDYVSKILDGCNLFPITGISVLIQRSLITIDEMNKLRIHDLLRDIGREIVREKAPEEPGRRTRLCSPEDVCYVLAKHEGTKSVEGLILDTFNLEDVSFDAKAFANMHRLRLLQLNYVHLTGGYEHLSKELRWLCWHGLPLNSLPSNLDMNNLVVLDMQNSRVKEVWKGVKLLRRLKILNLSHSPYLIKTPNFLGAPNLEKVILEGCGGLVEVHQSIGFLDKLILLNLKDCNNLMTLPDSICNLRSLQELNLSGCLKQVRSNPGFSLSQYLGSLKRKFNSIPLLPASFTGLCSLRVLNLSYCNLSEDLIPKNFCTLSSSLEFLIMDGNRFCTLPASIGQLSRLIRLSLVKCENLQFITDVPQSLKMLELGQCTLMGRLPRNTSRLSQLHYLDLEGCSSLQLLPELPSSITELRTAGCTSLQEVNIQGLTSLRDLSIHYDLFYSLLDEISHLSRLEGLNLEGCKNPQTLLMLPPTLGRLFLNGDTSTLLLNCGEIQSLETSLSAEGIHIEGKHHLGNILRNAGLFQDLYRDFEAWSTENEIPEWIIHQNCGPSISFEVSTCSGYEIIGLDVSAVFAPEKETDKFISSLIICNKTKGIQWGPLEGSEQPTGPLNQDVLWVRHITIRELWDYMEDEAGFGAHFEEGDQVEVSVDFVLVLHEEEIQGSVLVKKCGVLLVHKLDEEEAQSGDDPSMMQYIYDSDEEDDDNDGGDDDDIMDREESAVAYGEYENKSSRNEDAVGSSSKAKRLRTDH